MNTTKANRNKIISFILTVVMVLGMLPSLSTVALAEGAPYSSWIEAGQAAVLNIDYRFDEENRFIVKTAKGLASFANAVNGVPGYNQSGFNNRTVMLENDINLADGTVKDYGTTSSDGNITSTNSWNPIGDLSRSSSFTFNGTFDGNGKKISNLKIIGSNGTYLGLFGVSRGTIRNLGIDGGRVIETLTGNYGSFTGGIVGINHIQVENCYNTATIQGKYYVGGIAGCSPGYLQNCYSTGPVTLLGGAITLKRSAGALVGYANLYTISNNYWLSTSGKTGIGEVENGNYSIIYSIGSFDNNSGVLTATDSTKLVNGGTLLTALNKGLDNLRNKNLYTWKIDDTNNGYPVFDKLWVPPTYTVTYKDNSSTSGTVPTDNKAYKQYEGVIVLGNIGNLAREGYAFAGWNDGNNTYMANGFFYMGQENVTLTAMWKSTACDITAFSFENPAATGLITGNIIAVTVPNGTDVRSLVPTITVSPNASVSPASRTPLNFSNDISYTTTAEDGTTKTYIVRVTVEPHPDTAAVNRAKKAAEDASYLAMTQVTATDEASIKAALQTTAEQAVGDSTVQVTVNTVIYTAPIAGTSANPRGTDGRYAFTITVSKGAQTQTTGVRMIAITATPFTSVTDSQAVAAAKAAMKDGAVNVSFGADQTAKTAAVQSYVNTLLTGDAAGVTAKVTYNSVTEKYEVEISKGSVKDSTAITMTLNVVTDPDIKTVDDAKKAAEGASYLAMTQVTATDEASIKAALQTTAEQAVGDSTVKVTVKKESYTAPIAGTSAKPSGTNGSYVFTITVSKGNQTQTTEQKTITITATPFTGVTDEQAVAAAKAAIKDGTVDVPFGADQTAKTAAVQSYVNTLLTGDAAGVTAKVTYNSVTEKYEVEISKGSVKDSTAITMTLNVVTDPDIKTVDDAKKAAEGASYLAMTQVTATDEASIKAALQTTAEQAVGDSTVKVTVNKESYTAPIAGTSANPSGTDGSYAFTITVSKGVQKQTTEQKTITITATGYVVIPTFELTGEVQDGSSKHVSGASVKLMKGNTQIGTKNVSTDLNGKFTITGIPNGIYNLVVSKDDITVTTIIVIKNENNTLDGAITLPNGKTSSVVEVKPSTPDIVVGNLETQFNQEDNAYAQTPGNVVEIKLIAEKKVVDTVQEAANKIAAVASNKTIGLYLDLSVRKTLTTNSIINSTTQITTLPSIIEIIIPLPPELQGKDGLVVYRVHNGMAAALPNGLVNAVEGEYFVVTGDMIKIYTKNFSTYAIGYQTATPPVPTDGGSGGHKDSNVQPPTIIAEPSKGGIITISDDKKTVTITPDNEYVIADVIVDGKSIGATEKYTFTDSNNHKIRAVFVKKNALPYYKQNGEKVYIGFSALGGNVYKYIAPADVKVEFMENPKNFVDNTIPWAKPSIDFVTEREIFLGTKQYEFSPNESMTRAMFVTVIGRLYERSYGSISGTSTFSDVNANDYYAKYVAWANEKGIIKGIGGNKFAPNEKVTREQMSVIMFNLATILKKADVKDAPLAYADSASISTWAIDGAKYCQETNVIIGINGGKFAPKESATRGEVSAVIQRFIVNIMN